MAVVRIVWRTGRLELLARQGKPTTFEDICASLSLTRIDQNDYANDHRGVQLRLSRVSRNEVPNVMIEMSSPHIPKALQIAPKTITAALRDEVDIVVGDRAFDLRALVRGDL